jgi:O-6-methylguanine DNA methyltransferase
MIALWIEKADRWWLGVAHHDNRLVATVSASTREGAAASLASCLPRGAACVDDTEGSDWLRSVVRLLAALEAGTDEIPGFELCPDCVGEPLSSVLRAAALIPRGYVTTYGAIAGAAGTEARVVGNIMATNPLYPIVPCHRVVGSDLHLVGYTGKQTADALRRKLDRLKAEARGYDSEKIVGQQAGEESRRPGLKVIPAERVIEKAAREGIDPGVQMTLW